ncbi:MAG: hypothetical protein LBR67_09880 [Dysgonamonadaceae bacterium]|jgi:hypothetical protein|nr:hypothetical protein [Dysgonamonadaceae bacterium]
MIIAVDFDGTIVEHAYPKIGRPIPFAFEVLKKLQEETDHTLLLWTMREGELLDEALKFCEEKGLRFYAVNKNHPDEEPLSAPRKLGADVFIDDRNLGGIPDWGVIYNLLKSGEDDYSRFERIMNFSEANRNRNKNFFTRLGEALDKARGRNY